VDEAEAGLREHARWRHNYIPNGRINEVGATQRYLQMIYVAERLCPPALALRPKPALLVTPHAAPQFVM